MNPQSQNTQQYQEYQSQQFLLQKLETQDYRIEQDFRLRLKQEKTAHERDLQVLRQRIEILKKENENIQDLQKNFIALGKKHKSLIKSNAIYYIGNDWSKQLATEDRDYNFTEDEVKDWIYEAKHDHLKDYPRILELRESIKKYQQINSDLYEKNIELERSNWRKKSLQEQNQNRLQNRNYISPMYPPNQYSDPEYFPKSLPIQKAEQPDLSYENRFLQCDYRYSDIQDRHYASINPQNYQIMPEATVKKCQQSPNQNQQIYAKYCPGNKTYF